MSEIFQSTLFWVGLVAFVLIGAFVIDQIFRRMVNRNTEESAQYPHRVANELPRVLHKSDHDEVIELKDQTEISGK